MAEKFVPINKQSKKNQKEYNAQLRSLMPFNTGTRTHKTDKNPSRARRKEMDRRNYDER